MPISMINPIAATLPMQPDPLASFAEHLQRAQENDRQQAVQQLDFMMKMTEQSGGRFTPDPKELEKVAKRAGLPKGVLGGGGGQLTGAFGGMAEAARAKEKMATEQAQASLEATRAGTQSSLAQTRQTEQTTRFQAEHQKIETQANDALLRITKNDYTGDEASMKQQRIADATLYGMIHNLNPDLMARLQLTPAEAAKVEADAKEQRELLLKTARTSFATILSEQVIQDPKTGKSRNLTTDEMNAFLAGKPVTGLMTRSQFQDIQLKTAQAAAETERAAAEMIRARAAGKLTDIEIQKHESEITLNLARAKALRDKGVTHDFEDILKSFEALRQEKMAGGKPDPTLMRELERQMAAQFGGEPKQYKDWLGRMQEEGFSFPSVGQAAADADALKSVAPAKPVTAYEAGKAIPGIVSGTVGAAGEKTFGALENLNQFLTGLLGGQDPSTMTPEQLDVLKRQSQQPPGPGAPALR